MERRHERSETLEDVGRAKAAWPEKPGESKQGSSRAGPEKERTHASPVQERITEGHTNRQWTESEGSGRDASHT